MDEREAYPDWPAKRDAIRAALAARDAKLGHTGPLRLVPGAVTELDGTLARAAVRAAFLDIACAVEPRLLVELAGDPLDQYAAAWEAGGGSRAAAPISSREAAEDADDLLARCHEAALAPHGATWRWCRRWGVAFDDLLFEGRGGTPQAPGSEGGLLDVVMVLFHWRFSPCSADGRVPFHELLLLAYVDGHVPLELATPLRLPVPWWDPQREDRASATKRILAELGRAVRHDLDRIEAKALRVAVPPPAKRTGREHLAWLARYQFRGESFAEIARAVCKERQSVTEAVKDAASLVGLALREPSRPGPFCQGDDGPIASG